MNEPVMCYRFCLYLDCLFYCSLSLLDFLLQVDPSMVVLIAVAVTVTFAYGSRVLKENFMEISI